VKKLHFIWFLSFAVLINACTSSSTKVSPETRLPLPTPSHLAAPFPVIPTEDPTATPREEMIAPQKVTFETPDGVTITGDLYGSGDIAVIFSLMGECKPGWDKLAQRTAAQGLMALIYPWRGCIGVGAVDNEKIQKFVDDLRGAISFVRSQGAERVILAGASLGGVASAKLAIESGASGLVVMASPAEIADWGFKVEPQDLDTDIPKLFITAQTDDVVPPSKSRVLYELAAEPKEWQVYPGTAHGTDLFATRSGNDVQDRIYAFILAIVNTP
jgi:alpha-beta hydrolase superfamily lysophospholipase